MGGFADVILKVWEPSCCCVVGALDVVWTVRRVVAGGFPLFFRMSVLFWVVWRRILCV